MASSAPYLTCVDLQEKVGLDEQEDDGTSSPYSPNSAECANRFIYYIQFSF